MERQKKMQISKHDEIAREYNKTYRSNVRNHRRKLEILMRFLTPRKNSTMLEAGVGSGLHMKEVCKSCGNVVGLDISSKMLKEAKGEGLKPLVLADTENLPFRDSCFDAVYTISTLHHTDYRKSIKEFARVCRQGGRLGVTEPNPLNPQQSIGAIKRYSVEKGTFSMSISNLQREMVSSGMKILAKGSAIFIPTMFKNPSPLMLRIERVLEKLPVVRSFAGVNYVVGEKI
jgi:ubiquinone/menaquinone biosynthesis C-methylase UbiE